MQTVPARVSGRTLRARGLRGRNWLSRCARYATHLLNGCARRGTNPKTRVPVAAVPESITSLQLDFETDWMRISAGCANDSYGWTSNSTLFARFSSRRRVENFESFASRPLKTD